MYVTDLSLSLQTDKAKKKDYTYGQYLSPKETSKYFWSISMDIPQS